MLVFFTTNLYRVYDKSSRMKVCVMSVNIGRAGAGAGNRVAAPRVSHALSPDSTIDVSWTLAARITRRLIIPF